MTLVVVSEVTLARGPTLLMATDSMLSAGYRWPRGPKLFPLGAACAMAFEGDTQVAYPLATNVQNFISLADHLSRPDAEPAAIFGRVRSDISEAYDHLASNRLFDPEMSTCSLALAGWSWRLNEPVVNLLQPPPSGAPAGEEWTATDVVAGPDWQQHSTFFMGNGDRDPVAEAWSDLRNSPAARRPGYAAFFARIQDASETAVGGAPQVALLGPRVREIVGVTNAQNQRFLLGHRVTSGARGVTYYDEPLHTLR